MFIPTALQYQVSKHLAMCNPVLHTIADRLGLAVDKDLADDLILNLGKQTKYVAARRMMDLVSIIGEQTWLDTLNLDFELINSGLKVIAATKEDYNRLYFFDEDSKLLLPK